MSIRSRIFGLFRTFFAVLDLFGPVRTCSDLFGCIRMHLEAFGCVRTRSENFGNFGSKNAIFGVSGRYFDRLDHFLRNFLAPYLHHPSPERPKPMVWPWCWQIGGGSIRSNIPKWGSPAVVRRRALLAALRHSCDRLLASDFLKIMRQAAVSAPAAIFGSPDALLASIFRARGFFARPKFAANVVPATTIILPMPQGSCT